MRSSASCGGWKWVVRTTLSRSWAWCRCFRGSQGLGGHAGPSEFRVDFWQTKRPTYKVEETRERSDGREACRSCKRNLLPCDGSIPLQGPSARLVRSRFISNYVHLYLFWRRLGLFAHCLDPTTSFSCKSALPSPLSDDFHSLPRLIRLCRETECSPSLGMLRLVRSVRLPASFRLTLPL